MLVLPSNHDHQTFSIRPINRESDRPIIHKIFRQEFYGNDTRSYPDDGLWEIYDRMDTRDIFGAWLVSEEEHLLFLMEIHPPLQMDLSGDFPLTETDLGLYCFFLSIDDPANEPALKACLHALLHYPGITRVITSIGYAAPDEPKTILLQKVGFIQRPESTEQLSIFECTTPPGLL